MTHWLFRKQTMIPKTLWHTYIYIRTSKQTQDTIIILLKKYPKLCVVAEVQSSRHGSTYIKTAYHNTNELTKKNMPCTYEIPTEVESV